jgi:penicillin-binding protein 1C
LLCGLVFTLDHLSPPDLSRLRETGTEIVDREGRTIALLPAPGGVWRFAVTADEVAPVLLDTLVAIEDRQFWHHPGVNPLALARAALQDLRAGRIVSGGSTLTMQVARLLSPRRRTWAAKFVEILRALQLEERYSKREILGMWLTLAPYGGNLEGVRAGALAWFGTSPRLLDAAQAALLVAIPRRPEALRPDRHPALARALRDRILAATGGDASADMPSRRIALPRHAPQAMAAFAGGGPRVATTLDLPLQVALERLADQRLLDLPERASLAVVVADAATREIRALVSGGAGRGEARAGAMDLTRAIRSPGSAMKPFIYAMAFEDGIAGPDTRLDDLPRRFGGYAPEDFDRSFAGSVTAAQALRESLNLPAVGLLDRVGPLRFAATLQAAGVKLRLPAGANPSLPLALGGAGISLRQVVGLYAALATDGTASALRLRVEEAPRHVFLSSRAAATVASVLTQPFPDGGPPCVAWKTGTSWGSRDAWALGFDARHVVGVWVGRPDGTPLPGATGRSLALPMLGRVFDLLPAAPRPVPPRERGAEERASGRADALRLLFPPDDAVLSGDGPVVLRAMGGRRPLVFLVDGAKLAASPARREVAWTPPGPGFYRLTVLDAAGATKRVSVRIK